MRRKGDNIILFITVFVFIFLTITIKLNTAWGHKVNVFAYVEGDEIITESYFNDGSPCKDSIIQVFDTEGNELLSGKTDREGLYSFKIPKGSDLSIVLTASLGHKAEYFLKLSEIIPYSSENKGPIVKKSDHIKKEVFDKSGPKTEMDQIRIIVKESVEEAVAKSIKPFVGELVKSGVTKISITEIIGGIGYIFGIMGIIFYFKKRDK